MSRILVHVSGELPLFVIEKYRRVLRNELSCSVNEQQFCPGTTVMIRVVAVVGTGVVGVGVAYAGVGLSGGRPELLHAPAATASSAAVTRSKDL